MYGITIYITPTTLDDLTVCNKDFPAGSSTLDGFEEEDGKLKGSVKALATTDIIEIVSSGYVKQTFTWNDLTQNPDVTLVPKDEFEKTSDGINNYYCKDESARERLDLLSRDAITGVTLSNVATALGYTPANDSAVVKLTGNQTVAGEKTFTSNPWFSNSLPTIYLKNSGMDVTTTSVSSNQYSVCYFYDKNSQPFGQVYTAQYTNASRALVLSLLNTSGGTGNIYIRWDSSNGFYTYAPPTDVNGSIVTTVNKNKAGDGYFKLGNGLIVQWGIKSGSGNRSVTLPTPFTSSNYKVVVSPHNGNLSSTTWGVNNESTTGFDIVVSAGSGMNASWIAIGY